MAANYETLVDDFSGIPLPIAPAYMEQRESRFETDWHHPWHDRLNPLLRDLSGKALRASRIQKVNYDAHHMDYHRTFVGPRIPLTEEERIRPIVLAAAGYIPKKAITFDSELNPEVVELDDLTRRRLVSSNSFKVESSGQVRIFLKDYTFRQDLFRDNEALIDQLLESKDPKKRRNAGNELLVNATKIVAEPVEESYATAFKTEFISHDRAQSAGRFVLSSLAMRRHRSRLIEELRGKLALAVGL